MNTRTAYADDYQRLAARTMNHEDRPYSRFEIDLVWNAIGLADEAGEVAGAIKKAVFHEHGVDRAALIKELGDTAWYLSALCTVLGVNLSEVFERNVAKLEARYPDGFEPARSMNRAPEDH
jgi:NTP pyrophosphatase (non-canonical NTP hydrolase)